MAEMTDEEFEKFILENKSRIKKIISNDEDSELKSYLKDELKSMKDSAGEAKKKVDEKVDEKMSGFKDVFFNRDVQKHFIGAGIEMMLGFAAFIDAIPKSERVQDIFDEAEEARKSAAETYCAKNPDCPRKKAEAKKIELD